MKVDLKGKTAVITGAGGAIGSAMAMEFAQNGANVVVADLREDTMMATVEEIRKAGGSAVGIGVDVANRESAFEMITKSVEAFGRVDCLINNAGINGGPEYRKPIHEYNDDLWHRIINVDLNGVYYCSKAAVLQLQKQGTGGTIINISSIAGLTPLRLQCAFTAAKAGVINLTKAMALELAPLNIRVNCIAPGSILFEGTRQLFYADQARAEALLSHIPLKRPGDPKEISAMTCFLASEDSSYMTGSVVTIDGGWTCGYTRDF
jgi:NAD(P)-dependent dehydrogenase (short-subunit alcohol dehydrogenase family)